MNWRERIVVDPDVLAGKPLVRGTRISVEYVLDAMAAGATEDELLASHPRLTRADVLACVAYAADVIRSERVLPLTA